jgi:hypothetical protein
LLLFAAAVLSWTINSLSAGGGSLLFVAASTYVVGAKGVAPIAAISSLIASGTRLLCSGAASIGSWSGGTCRARWQGRQ